LTERFDCDLKPWDEVSLNPPVPVIPSSDEFPRELF
jgi:hypothetical protein